MKNTKAKWIALLLAAAMALSLTACGGSSSSGSTDSPVNANATGAETQVDVINIGIESDPADLSPFGPGTDGRTPVIDCIYETLGYYEDGEFVGVLAKDYEVSEDETTLTYYLYEDIYDQAGNHFTASDVVFSYNAKLETGNLYNVEFIESVEAVDDYTVQFNLIPPLKVTNIANMVQNVYCVTEAAYNASSDGMVSDGIVSTAHYKVASYQGSYLLTLERNEDYWQTDESAVARRSQANVGTINYYILSEANQRTMALESETIDMCYTISSDDVYKFADGGEQDASYWVYQAPENLSMVLLFNLDDSRVTADANLRKAIGYAINNAIILQSVFNNYGAVNYDLGRSGTSGFNEDWITADSFQQYDVEKAKELVEASDYNGESISLLVQTVNTSTDTAALIQGFCAAAGITIEINSVDSAVTSTYFADSTAWDLYLASTAAETYVVQPWVKYLDNSSGVNLCFGSDDTLEELLLLASNLETSTQDTIDACHDYIMENGYAYGVVNQYNSYIVPEYCKEVVLGYKAEILPGACTYVEQ